MTRMQYNLKGNDMLEVVGFDSKAKWKKEGFASNEPIFVLDTRRSLSPSTTTSTLSSSFGDSEVGSTSGSADNIASLAVISNNNLWPPERRPANLAATYGDQKDK
ncbi:hypothetical protein CsSME_00039516 [Camellia sinensis var. sinensis]